MVAEVIDWELAAGIAARLAPAGPAVGIDDATRAVRDLRRLADEARGPVADITGLVTSGDGETQVVDRVAWARANVDAVRVVLAPLAESLPVGAGFGSRATALELGAALAWLSTKVLGQFEALVAAGRRQRLLLVAPNIVAAERALEVDPRDFRLWVCLHEETHRAQFEGVGWLEDYISGELRVLVSTGDEGVMATMSRLVSGISRLSRALSSSRSMGITDLVEAFQTPVQRESFDRLTALMTLLEGHADVVMDLVGPEVVPSVALIRERFDVRRSSSGSADGLARRLIGMDAKLRQYADGARFVRTVVDAVGMPGFNRVWTDAGSLPSREEILDPHRWIRRVAS